MSGERQITRSAGVVGLFTLASRILGLVRDAVVAAMFSRWATDAFFVANTIPNVLRRLLAEGTLTVAFIPVFTEVREQHGEDAARAMLRSSLGAVGLVLTLVSALCIFGAPWIVRAFAFGFVDNLHKLGVTILLTRIMMLFFITTGLTALAMGVLNTCRHFAAPSLAPVLLNAVIITTVLAGTPMVRDWGYEAITSAACGVLLGGVAQVLLQFPFLARHGMLVVPSIDLRHPGVVRVARLMIPAVFGLAIYEINVILARQLASFLPEGSISYLYYAQRLIEFPMGIFAVAVATVAMPSLSSQAVAGDMQGLKDTYRYALRMVLFIMLPATAGLLALALPLTSILFQRGQFTHAMAQATASTLAGFLVGLWAGAGVKQTVPVYYALQDTKTPVKVAAVSLVAYAAAAFPLQHVLQTTGLALAVAISSMVNFSVLLLILRRRLGRLGLRRVVASGLKSAASAAVCGVVAWQVARAGEWQRGGADPLNVGVLLAAVAAGIAVYLACAWLLRTPELFELARAFRRRRG